MNQNTAKLIHKNDNEVNNISEYTLLHDIINPHKRAKNIGSHYSLIIHGCMNTRRFGAKFENFKIILESECSSTIVMGRLVQKLYSQNML